MSSSNNKPQLVGGNCSTDDSASNGALFKIDICIEHSQIARAQLAKSQERYGKQN
jgi:hypothetical protein